MRIVKEEVCASTLCGNQLARRTRPASAPALLLLRNDWVIVSHEVSHREFGQSQIAVGLHETSLLPKCSSCSVNFPFGGGGTACMINRE